MKSNKTNVFFAVLTSLLCGSISAQTAEEAAQYTKNYDHEKINKLKEFFLQKHKNDMKKATEIAKERGLPMSGTTEDGRYYEIVGLNDDGDLKYYVTYNNVTPSSIETARAQHLHNGGSLGINIEGQGMNIGEWDGGPVLVTHQSLGASRATQMDGGVEQGGPSSTDGGYHATHVAGTMIANNVNSSIKGIAPKGNLKAYDWGEDTYEMTEAAQGGLLVSNHSYGANYAANLFHLNSKELGRYNGEASALDGMLFNLPYYLPVYAAGNDRSGASHNGQWVNFNPLKGGYDLLHGAAVAKNSVTVAAINGIADYTSASDVVMTSFSNWGPTDDFRIKPDISAKGRNVKSASNESTTATATLNGTSMAAPSVTAVFALWQQYFKKLWPIKGYMKAATVKALMAHTALEAGTSPGPDPKFGWGVINAKGGADVLKEAKTNTGSEVLELTLNQGETYEKEVVLDGTTTITATIAWTDRASGAKFGEDNDTPALVNDLDLRIIRPNGQERYPYALNKDFNSLYVNQADNDVDVIEKVEYKSTISGVAPAGTYKIRVTHKGNTLVGENQDFSLIISGIAPDLSSVDENYFQGLEIYPNPATDFVDIQADSEVIKGAKVALFDLTGKKVIERTDLFEYSNASRLDVSSLTSGVYMLQIENNGKKQVKKIVKK